MSQARKIFFASDLHLGAPNWEASKIREKRFIRWLDSIKDEAEAIYLMGDIFDFWFEYNTVVPKGFLHLFGKLAQLRAANIPIFLFRGNHDLWLLDYFEKELGIPVFKEPIIKEIHGKKFFLAHGDGLGPGDHGYKMLKKVFTNPVCRWLFKWLHPDIGTAVANYWSRRSRLSQGETAEKYLGEDKEWLILFAKEQLKKEAFDYFIFGHRHLPLEIHLNNNAKYVNLGDWINHYSYAVFDGQKLELQYYQDI